MQLDRRENQAGQTWKLTLYAKSDAEREFLTRLREGIEHGLVTVHTEDGNHEFTTLKEYEGEPQ